MPILDITHVNLRYFNVDLIMKDSLAAQALGSIDDLKHRALDRLGIDRQGEETPCDRWMRAMAEENSLPVRKPAEMALADAIMSTKQAFRFMFWLA